MRATLSTVGSKFYIEQIFQFSQIFQFRIFATSFKSFVISSVFELDTSSFGFWASFHVPLRVLFQNWVKLQNLPVPVSRSGGQNVPPQSRHGKNTLNLIGSTAFLSSAKFWICFQQKECSFMPFVFG